MTSGKPEFGRPLLGPVLREELREEVVDPVFSLPGGTSSRVLRRNAVTAGAHTKTTA